MSSPQAKTTENLTPASAAKRRSIVKAAARVFMSSGYGAASMDQIASVAGVSKQTVYNHFSAKDALFEEIVGGKCEELMGANGLRVTEGGDPEAVLTDAARVFMKVVLNDESITLYRIILSECGRFPELAEAFYRAGPKSAIDRLGIYLGEVAAQGRLKIDDPKAAASMFFAMMRGEPYMLRLLGLREMLDDTEIEKYARIVAQAFLRVYRP